MITKIILLTTLVLGIFIDIWLAVRKDQTTFSKQITIWGQGRYPILVLFLSWLLGHFFVPYKIDMPLWVTFAMFIVSACAIQIIRIFNEFPKWVSIIIMVYGIILGGVTFV